MKNEYLLHEVTGFIAQFLFKPSMIFFGQFTQLKSSEREEPQLRECLHKTGLQTGKPEGCALPSPLLLFLIPCLFPNILLS